MQISNTSMVQCSASEIWRIIAADYARVGEWASSVQSSKERKGPRLPNASCHGRVCQTTLGEFSETIVHYDRERLMLSYQAKGKKMPFFVKNMQADWKLTPIHEEQTQVEMKLSVTLLPVFSWFMPIMMRMQMGPVIKQTLEELKHYAERGEFHPRVAQQQEKIAA